MVRRIFYENQATPGRISSYVMLCYNTMAPTDNFWKNIDRYIAYMQHE